MEKCPICERVGIEIESPRGKNFFEIKCRRCSSYKINESVCINLHRYPYIQQQRTNVSSYLFENSGFYITKENIEFFKTIPTPSVGERAEKLLKYLAKKINYGISREIVPLSEDWDLLSASWSKDYSEVIYLLDGYLIDGKSYLEKDGNSYLISPKGWDFLESIKYSKTDSQEVFVAMWFKSSMEEIYEHAIKGAIQETKYKAVRIDKHPHNNQIIDEILAGIRRCKFMIADFTGNRGGVYYEAGFAKGLGKEVIWTVEETSLNKVHFDNKQYNFIQWNRNAMDDFKQKLVARIGATIGLGTYSGK